MKKYILLGSAILLGVLLLGLFVLFYACFQFFQLEVSSTEKLLLFGVIGLFATLVLGSVFSSESKKNTLLLFVLSIIVSGFVLNIVTHGYLFFVIFK